MPIVPAADRIARYSAALSGDRLPANLVAYRDEMVAKFTTWSNIIVPKEIAVSDYLISMSEPEQNHTWYQAFMRAGMKLKLRAGELVHIPDIEKTILIGAWTSRGLIVEMLNYIMDEIIDPSP